MRLSLVQHISHTQTEGKGGREGEGNREWEGREGKRERCRERGGKCGGRGGRWREGERVKLTFKFLCDPLV